MRRLSAAALVVFLAYGWVAAEATAQDSWLDRAKRAIESQPVDDTVTALTDGEIDAGLREALRVGTERVVARLGATDGFNADPDIHIPLPHALRRVDAALGRIGMSELTDDLEVKLNRAAEAATPKARALFVQAIQDMSLDDARAILNGPDDAATRYFEARMSPDLAAEMRPVIDAALSDVGALQAYEAALSQYRELPFVPDVRTDLTDHVVDRGMAGIFHYVAREEAAIRQDPAKRTTELLKKVF